MAAGGIDLFVRRLAGGCDPLSQVIQSRRVVRLSSNRQEQSASVGGFLDRADVGLGESVVSREVVLIDDDELSIDGPGHSHAQQGDDRHQDQQPDCNSKDLYPNRNSQNCSCRSVAGLAGRSQLARALLAPGSQTFALSLSYGTGRFIEYGLLTP